MLSTVFDAIAAGQPEPTMTPLIALPLHQPPNIDRNHTFAQRASNHSPVCRKLTSDTWLFNNTDNAELGRILSNQVLDENRLKITTSEGVYIVNAAMRVLRGKSEKKSIHGHIVSVYSLMV